MKTRLLSLVAAGAVLFGIATAPTVQAAPPDQVGGAAGLVAAVVQLDHTISNNQVAVLDGSFNNLTALNNVLNHSPILNQNNISVNVLSVSDFLNNSTIPVTLQNVLTNFLNNNTVSPIIGVSVLSGGIVIFN